MTYYNSTSLPDLKNCVQFWLPFLSEGCHETGKDAERFPMMLLGQEGLSWKESRDRLRLFSGTDEIEG